MARQLIIAAFVFAAAASSNFATATTANTHAGASDANQHNPSNINFPPQFYVTTGTTIPFMGSDPVAQSGAIYYDELNQKVRVDNFWLGNQRSFVADLAAQRGYVISNGQCSTLKLTGDLGRYGVPDGAIRALDPVAVRGVPVLHYTAVEKEETIQLVDFFVRPMNLSSVYDSPAAHDNFDPEEYGREEDLDAKTAARRHSDAAAAEGKMREETEMGGAFFVPWQIRSKRLRQRSIAPTAYSSTSNLPNWRFFGEPMDEVISADDAAEEFGDPRLFTTKEGVRVPRGAVERLTEDVTVTVDFYNFVPSQPSPSMFAMPAVCADQEPKHEYSYNVNVHQAQRMLVDMSFNSRPGRKLMDHLWRSDHVKRVGAGTTGKTALPSTADSNTNAQQQPVATKKNAGAEGDL